MQRVSLEELQNTDNETLVNKLVSLQSEIEHIYNMRCDAVNNREHYIYYNNRYLDAIDYHIEIKSEILRRMNYASQNVK